eukprot:5111180-Pleurochrysis_carterae.AAC.1
MKGAGSARTWDIRVIDEIADHLVGNSSQSQQKGEVSACLMKKALHLPSDPAHDRVLVRGGRVVQVVASLSQ